MITTLFHAASTTTSPVTHVRGGEGEGGGSRKGGYDNDLVSRVQHDHIQSRPHPVEFRHSLFQKLFVPIEFYSCY